MEQAQSRSYRSWAAVLQGLAVLLGILTAFAIDAAWEGVQERRAVGALLESLAEELASNQILVSAHVQELTAELGDTEDYLVGVAAAPSGPVSQDSIRAMIADMGPLRISSPQRAAFEDLTSGGLQSIEDGRIRRLILAYGQALENDAVTQLRAQEWFDRRAQVYDELEGDLVGMGAAQRGGWAGRSDVRFEIDPSSFVGNRRYGNLLAARAFHLRSVITAHNTLLARLVELSELLERLPPVTAGDA